MDRPETRELVYFIAVAEECHFGRAAERLGMTQPPLSRAISQLERRLGVALLDRTGRRVALTVAGDAFLRDARRALQAVDTAVAGARRVAQPVPRLLVALKPGSDGGLLPAILEAYRAEHDAVDVDVRTCRAGEQVPLLRSGHADVAFLHEHLADLDGLDQETLLVEGQVAVVAARHRLAGRPWLSLGDIAGELLPVQRLRENPVQALQEVALGHAVVLIPASLRSQLRRDVACIPVPDAATTRVLVVWPAQHRRPGLASFIRTATRLAASHAA